MSRQPIRSGARKSKTILLVDDDALLLRVISEVLMSQGYKVIPCSDGMSAVHAFKSGREIDLLLADLQVSDMDGIMLANILTSVAPSLSVLLMSAAESKEVPLWDLWRKRWCFLPKPISTPLLFKTVEYLCGLLPLQATDLITTLPALLPDKVIDVA